MLGLFSDEASLRKAVQFLYLTLSSKRPLSLRIFGWSLAMGTMSGVCPAQNILLGSSIKTADSCVLSSKQGVNTLLKLKLLLFFIYANFAPMTAYQDGNFQWVAPNYPRRPLSLPKYALALARRLIRETTQSIFVKSNPLAVSLSFTCFP